MTKQYKRSTDAELLLVDEEWVILHPVHCTVTKLNEVGQYCWELLAEARTANALALKLHEKYGVTEGKALEDAEHFVNELVRIGLVEHAS